MGDSDYDAFDVVKDLELDRAIFFITQTVVGGMVKDGRGGSIIDIGSMWAHQAIAATPCSAYSLGKAGLHALTHNLAIELAPYYIRVNTGTARAKCRISPARRYRERCRRSSSCARATACSRPLTRSLAYMLRVWVLIVFSDT
jgi:NAD(P)-dependent dehydrogenase (short-subunit alcohol dehydrogenase family)